MKVKGPTQTELDTCNPGHVPTYCACTVRALMVVTAYIALRKEFEAVTDKRYLDPAGDLMKGLRVEAELAAGRANLADLVFGPEETP